MEIKYKTHVVWPLIFMFLGATVIISAIMQGKGLGRVILAMPILIIGIYGLVNYYFVIRKTQIFITDEGTKSEGRSAFFMKWKDLLKVDVSFLKHSNTLLGLRNLLSFFDTDSFIINVYSWDSKIIIRSEAENIHEVIQLLKNKAGTRFDTKAIPLKFKMVQYKNGKLDS